MTQHWSTCQLGKTVLVSHRTKIMARLRQKIYPMGSMSFYMVLGQKMWQTGGQKNWYMDVHAFKTRYFIGVHTSPYQEPWWDPGKQWVRATPARSENKRILLQQTLRYHFAEWKTQHRTNRCRNGTIKKTGPGASSYHTGNQDRLGILSMPRVMPIPYTYTYTYTYTYAYAYTYTYTYTYYTYDVHIHVHIHIQIQIHIHIHMHVHVHIQVYIYIFT